jgi:hypothetical protein
MGGSKLGLPRGDYRWRGKSEPKRRRGSTCWRAAETEEAKQFVILFRRPDSSAIIWKQTFTQQAGEFVAEMVLVQDGNKYLVDHVMVL